MSHPLFYEKNLSFLDLETTGLHPVQNEIISIAILIEQKKENPYIPPAKHLLPKNPKGDLSDPHTQIIEQPNGDWVWFSRVAPKRTDNFSESAKRINGYTPEKWKGAPSFEDVAPFVQEVLRNKLIVAHNAPFDLGFLRYRMEDLGLWQDIGHHTIDTATLAIEHLGPIQFPSASLRKICDFFGIPYSDIHDAVEDTLLCQKIYHLLKRSNFLQRWIWWVKNKLRK